MKKASWILITVTGVALTVLSLVSAVHAYWTEDDYAIGGMRVSRIAAGDTGLEIALRGVRGTSAAYGAGFGVFVIAIAVGPYRRGDAWAWKALFVAGLAQFVLVALRVPALGTQLGLSAALLQGIPLAVGLLLDAGRLKAGPK